MKKIALTIAIVLGMTIGAMAQNGGLFGKGPQRGYATEQEESFRGDGLLNLPNTHGSSEDQTSPLGTGALLLIGFGAAYALKKRQK